MDIALRHSVTYGTKRDVPVSLVAHSLLANERLLIEAIRVLERISPSFEVQAISVRVAEVTNSSPFKQMLVAALVVAFQKDLTEEVPDLIEKLTGVNVPDNMDTLVTLLVVVIALNAVSSAVERLMPGKSVKKIIAEYEAKKDRISELSGVSKESIEAYCSERTTKGGQSLYEKALSFFAPAKLEPNVGILLPSGETILPEVIQEVPLKGEVDKTELEDTYQLDNVVIDIHRSDMDEKKYGWRAVIPSVTEKKVRLELDTEIDPAPLYGVRQLVGDVVVIEGLGDLGEVEVKRYRLLQVHSINAQ